MKKIGILSGNKVFFYLNLASWLFSLVM